MEVNGYYIYMTPTDEVLGPLLFVIYVNDLNENVDGWVSKFEDDTKILRVVDSVEGCQRIQWDIDQFLIWAERWRMEINPGNCEVLHFGRSNIEEKYTVNSSTLKSIDVQRDFGAQAHSSLKVAMQVDRVVKEAYSMLTFIGRGTEYKSQDVMVQFYKTLVGPHLEYCIYFWSPHYRKDVEALQRVQKRFIGMMPGLKGVNDKERLEKLRLFSLGRRRLRKELIEVRKIMKYIDRVEGQNLFPRDETSKTKGHAFK
eukprot:g44485.t1